MMHSFKTILLLIVVIVGIYAIDTPPNTPVAAATITKPAASVPETGAAPAAPAAQAVPAAPAATGNVSVTPIIQAGPAQSPAINVTTAPVAVTIPTTKAPEPHAIIDTLSSSLCKHCECNGKKNKLNCSNLNMTEWFTQDEWDTLVYGDVKFDQILITDNELTNIPVFPQIPNLKILSLRNNKITKIANGAFAELQYLELLDLSYNLLTSKELRAESFHGKYNPVNYEPLKNLRDLNLASNDLHTLDPDLFGHFPVLETLDLSHNTFEVIDRLTETAISNTPTLKDLDMSFMQLKTLPNYIFHAHRDLEVLSLNGNLFKTIPEELGRATSLKSLFLDDNQFTELDGENVFPELKSLEELNLSYCSNLVKIGQGAFSKLTNLKKLRMTNNPKLSFIHGNAMCRQRKNQILYDFPPIEELLLHNNNLSILPDALLEHFWNRVKIIDLRSNPWQCDCDNDFLVNILFTQVMENNPTLVANVNCTTPDAWKGQPIKTIHDRKINLRCADIYGNHPENDGSILVGILIGVLVGIPLALFILVAYKRGCFGFLRRSDPGSYNRAFYSKAGQDDYSI